MIKDNENVLIVCSPEDAEYIIKSSKDPHIKDILVITDVVPIGKLTIIPKNEFLDFLDERFED